MKDVIRLLPDSIANQIAAGEVVQRPASVVKELIENAIDAGADQIQLCIIDAGRTLIQVIDNGKGMTATDARMAFERHATSKIEKAEDLFALTTMGFRGEALPSIAAVSQVELKTKTHDSEIGTLLRIEASKVIEQEMTSCPQGSNFMVKNLFYNIPARRKFLKSNETERKNILSELERIALVYPDIEIAFIENGIEAFRYPIASLKQRIINVFGKSINQQLLTIDVETNLVKIKGYIGKPENARKNKANQFFFVNGRYMRSAYFNSAVMSPYQQLIRPDEKPNYFLYIEVDPKTIDVNIHPTKTEVKFENEQLIWQIISASVRETLGKFNAVPSIDFDQADTFEIPVFNPNETTSQPQVVIDETYNPFANTNKEFGRRSSYDKHNKQKKPDFDWTKIYNSFQRDKSSIDGENLDEFNSDFSLSFDMRKSIENENDTLTKQGDIKFAQRDADDMEDFGKQGNLKTVYQYKGKYIVTSIKSGMVLINQHRAHKRILYEYFVGLLNTGRTTSQRVLFPEIIELSFKEASYMQNIMPNLEKVGFEISNLGGNSFAIHGIPSELSDINASAFLQNILSDDSCSDSANIEENLRHVIALSLADSAAIPSGKILSIEEMNEIVSKIFSLQQNKYTPDGKSILVMLEDDYLDKLFR